MAKSLCLLGSLIKMDGGSTFFGRNPVFFWGGVTYYNGRRKYFFSDRNPVFEVGYLIIMDGGSTFFLTEILYLRLGH